MPETLAADLRSPPAIEASPCLAMTTNLIAMLDLVIRPKELRRGEP
jgi:hypothetical protein